MSRRVPAVTILLVAAIGLASAQSPMPAAAGRNAIGTVDTYPNPGAGMRMGADVDYSVVSGTVNMIGGRAGDNVRVELRDLSTGAVVSSSNVTSNGSFVFSQVPSGTYEVTAIAGINQSSERVSLGRGDRGYVTLRLNSRPVDTIRTGGYSVSAAQYEVPKQARKKFQNAQRLMQKGDVPQASKELDAALTLYPKFAEALVLRGVIRLDEDKMTDAAADLEAAVKVDPNLPMAYIVLGSCYNSQERYDDALRTLEQARRLAPATWQVAFETGRALAGKHDFQASLPELKRAQSLIAGDYAPMHYLKAHVYLALKDYNNAVVELQTFLKMSPKSPDAAVAQKTLDHLQELTTSANLH